MPNKNVVLPDLGLPVKPFTEKNLQVITKLQPIKDNDLLEMLWILPNLEKEYTTKPLEYFSHLFGHEGENSLLSYLKQEDYAMALSASSEHEMSVFSSFNIEITLTKNGLAHVNDVVSAVFKYA